MGLITSGEFMHIIGGAAGGAIGGALIGGVVGGIRGYLTSGGDWETTRCALIGGALFGGITGGIAGAGLAAGIPGLSAGLSPGGVGTAFWGGFGYSLMRPKWPGATGAFFSTLFGCTPECE